MLIEALENHVLFSFADEINNGRFVNTTKSGIQVSTLDTNQSSAARWAVVAHVGPKCLDVHVGDFILIEPGKWTNGFYVEGHARLWKTDEDQIMAISDSPESIY